MTENVSFHSFIYLTPPDEFIVCEKRYFMLWEKKRERNMRKNCTYISKLLLMFVAQMNDDGLADEVVTPMELCPHDCLQTCNNVPFFLLYLHAFANRNRYRWIPSSLVLTPRHFTTELYKNVTKLPMTFAAAGTTVLTTEAYALPATRGSNHFSNRTFDNVARTDDFGLPRTTTTLHATEAKVTKSVNRTIDKSKLFIKASRSKNATSILNKPSTTATSRTSSLASKISVGFYSCLVPPLLLFIL